MRVSVHFFETRLFCELHIIIYITRVAYVACGTESNNELIFLVGIELRFFALFLFSNHRLTQIDSPLHFHNALIGIWFSSTRFTLYIGRCVVFRALQMLTRVHTFLLRLFPCFFLTPIIRSYVMLRVLIIWVITVSENIWVIGDNLPINVTYICLFSGNMEICNERQSSDILNHAYVHQLERCDQMQYRSEEHEKVVYVLVLAHLICIRYNILMSDFLLLQFTHGLSGTEKLYQMEWALLDTCQTICVFLLIDNAKLKYKWTENWYLTTFFFNFYSSCGSRRTLRIDSI